MKRICAITIIICVVLALPAAAVTGEPVVQAPAVVLMDQTTGTVLFELNSHERLAPASVTKVMTLLLIMEAIDAGTISMQDMVTTSEYAASMGGSQIYLEEGEQMVLEDVLKAVVVSSANDGAVALAEHLCGSEQAFVALMNQRAEELGMEDTNFVNCTGLDTDLGASEHLTSAYDIAIMSRQLLMHEDIKRFTTIWMDTVRNGEFGLSNTNKLVRFYSGATGLKTGFTARARYCLAASAGRDGMELIATVMNAPSSDERFTTAKNLLDFGFANYTIITPEPEQELTEIPVLLGEAAAVTPVLAESSGILIDKSIKNSITTEITLAESLTAPVEAGQKLGEMNVVSDGEVLQTVDIVAAQEIPRLTTGQIWRQMIRKLFMVSDEIPSEIM